MAFAFTMQPMNRNFTLKAYSKVRDFFITESPLKMIKNAFCFTLKSLFVCKIFKFLSWVFGHVEKTVWLETRLVSKAITSQPGEQTIAIHILPNMSWSKGNQAMKFGQLIEYNMRSIFFHYLLFTAVAVLRKRWKYLLSWLYFTMVNLSQI